MNSNKDKILAAASELLLSQGPTGLSVRAIANLAGVFYNWYIQPLQRQARHIERIIY